MRLLSTDPDEPGVFAVGQVAYGIVALGQMATGVIAIGQVARGVIAIGQGAIGLIAVGQGAIGLYAGLAMLGIFGRGFPLPVVPKLPRPRQLPGTTDLSQVRMGYGDGWIEAELAPGPDQVPLLYPVHGGVGGEAPIADIRLAAKLRPKANAELAQTPKPRVVAHIKRVGDGLVCDRLLHVPIPLTETEGYQTKLAFRMAVLVALALVFWQIVWLPIAQMFQ
ncbi:MAG: hypothetical protein KC457_08560 [Myxococcales bacterium]|nr:hypothetical protein [Myxococcales bacterium]